VVALLLLPRFVGSPRYLEPQAALVQNLVDRFAVRDPAKRQEPLERWRKRLKGKLTFYDTSGTVIASTHEVLSPPTKGELKTLETDKWALDWRRIVVRSDDGKVIGVYVPTTPGFPWGFVCTGAARRRCGDDLVLAQTGAPSRFARDGRAEVRRR
jgi:hypothetical protein